MSVTLINKNSSSIYCRVSKSTAPAIERSTAAQFSFLATSLTALGLCVPVHAQTASAAQGEVLEEVIVTGSRIRQPNLTSTSPIQVVTAEEIKQSGRKDITDLLNQLPQINSNSLGQDLGNRTSGLTTAGGVSTADLRGLGPNRTLVLIDGRRLGVGSPNTAITAPAPDLDQIPSALVERVDVLTGGASAVYGSDAIAGVVNFIMKKNFEGVQVDYQLGEDWHHNHNHYVQQAQIDAGYTPLTGSTRDGRNHNFDIIAGHNFGDNIGNLTGYFSYRKAEPIRSSQRDYGGCQLNANDNFDGAVCNGSANSNLFTSPIDNNDYQVKGNSFIPWGDQTTVPPAIFNSQPYIYIARQDERSTAGFMGHLDVNEFVKPYIEFAFMKDKTHQEIAPSALFNGGNPVDPLQNGNYNINCDNPLLSAQQAQLLCGGATTGNANVAIGRRNVEGGGRSSDFEHSNYRAALGATGKFASAWNYEAYVQYYYTSFFTSENNYLNYQNIANALQVTGTAANPVCISGPPCVPYNIFTEGGVSQNQLAYLYQPASARGDTTLRTIHADVGADLGAYNIKSPFANDGMAFNIGYEHRSEQQTYSPDEASVSGLLAGFGTAVALDKSYSVNEGFVEFRVPIAQDKPGIKDLAFDTGYRRSDYSTSGAVDTYKFEVQYAPLVDMRLRGSYQRAVRAPNLVELFSPQFVGQVAIGTDPCAPTRDDNNNIVAATASLAQCQNSGVTATQYGNGSTTNTIPQGTGSQLSQLQGGNPNLKAETADTYSFGVTLTPSFMHDFTASIDYYNISIKDEVSTINPGIILSNCLDTGAAFFCDQIRRSNNGGLIGNSLSSRGYIVQTSINVGAQKVSGVDLQMAYKLPLPQQWGTFAVALNGSYLIKQETTPVPNGPSYDCAGLFGFTCQTVNPTWHHVLRLVWNSPWQVGVTAAWRYLGSVKLDSNDTDPSLRSSSQFVDANGDPAYNYFNARIPSYGYLDLSTNWQVTKQLELRAGVNNALDKDPPIVTAEIISGGAANTYEYYDGLGREVYVAFTAKF